jgi:hypothetical protein
MFLKGQPVDNSSHFASQRARKELYSQKVLQRIVGTELRSGLRPSACQDPLALTIRYPGPLLWGIWRTITRG